MSEEDELSTLMAAMEILALPEESGSILTVADLGDK